MATTKKLRYSRTEEEQLEAWQAGTTVFDEVVAVDEELDASVCANCGEPLAWHEQAACQPPTKPSEISLEPGVAAGSGFVYSLGSQVIPISRQQTQAVVWRGQLRERHPATGLVHRVPVYRLDDGHWDCYREDELQAA